MSSRRRRTAHETVKLNVNDVRQAISRTRTDVAALVVLQGAESDIGAHILVDRPVTLGRDPLVELPLEDEGISRRHCRVTPDGARYLLEDLRSTNGTLLNGQPLKNAEELRAGDRIYLGGCVVKFTHADSLEVSYHAQMDALVGTDDLTGLVAKRRFDAMYVRAVDAARLAQQGLAVLMLDMDGLKQINDTHGHPVGAHTIAEVGRIIGGVVGAVGGPSQPTACRFGGDEFAAFLPGADKAKGLAVGEEIRQRVARHHFEKDGIVVKPTISVGVAAFPDDGRAADELLRRADEALYRAKRGGRDRVVT